MEALNKRRSVLKGLLTRIGKYATLLSIESHEEEVKERVNRAKEILQQYTRVEDEMFALDASQASESEEFEEQYYQVIAKLNRWLRKQSMSGNNQPVSDTKTNQNPHYNDIKLPRLNIPNFSGDYRDWQSFIDLFDTTVHKNSTLSPAQKLQYLKGLLTGDASNLLRHFSITDANYIEAYQILNKRYDRKSITANAFIKLFIDQPIIHQANSTNIRKLLDTSDEAIRGLKALGEKAESRDVWLIYLLYNKLDDESKQLWKRLIVEEEFPTLKKFYEFLAHRSDELEGMKSFSKNPISRPNSVVKAFHANSEFSCPVCQTNSHQLYECTKFKSMDILSRRNLIKEQARCFNCLNTSHGVYECRTKGRCYTCGKKHHSLLHFVTQHNQTTNESSTGNVHLAENNESESIPINQPQQSVVSHQLLDLKTSTNLNISVYQSPTKSCSTLLPTALIKIMDITGEWQLCHALLDSGAQSSFASENLIRRLQLPRKRARIDISGLGQTRAGTSRGKTTCLISSRINQTTLSLECLILPKLTSNQPTSPINRDLWSHLDHLPLADPNFSQPKPIDLLIGSDHFFSLLSTERITGQKQGLIAQHTIFGWVVAGPLSLNDQNHTTVNGLNCEINIDQSLRRFWEIEEITSPSQLTKYTEEEIMCEDHFSKYTTRSYEGKFVVRLPFKSNQIHLSNTFHGAIRRLQAVEKRFTREPEFREAYKLFMEEYLELNHMEVIPPTEIHRSEGVYYLPHHGVIRESSSTTKLRVVFDASFKTLKGNSLNDALMVGPTVYESLISVLMRFRLYKFVFTADIEKMFRQIILHPSDRDYHRIVWRSDPTQQPTHYRLRTVTYGTASAPYLATKTLQVIGNETLQQNQLVAEKILHDFYVDDFMSGAHTLEEAQKITQDVTNLLKSYGFNLRKWAANQTSILNGIPSENKEQLPINIQDNDSSANIKLLGIQWNPLMDSFQFTVAPIQYSKGSKREVLSQSARIFDPLGWLAPAIVTIKLLFQGLWLLHLDWDDELPESEANIWQTIKRELPELEKIRIPRWHMTSETGFELHGFSDASEKAYAAVVYCKIVDENGVTNVSLVASKTKVAPIKQISIPRLELCAASLLTKLIKTITEAFRLVDTKVTMWTDSKIVLDWLSSPPRRWSTFIANRTSDILSSFSRQHWRYVNSATNPADCASRGLTPIKLINFNLWWNGPIWLKQTESQWPHQEPYELGETSDLLREERKPTVLSAISYEKNEFNIVNELVTKISSFQTIVRVLAWIHRYVLRLKSRAARKERLRELTVDELIKSHNFIIRSIQNDHFSIEICKLKANQQVSKSSKIHNLNPFLDESKLLRVGGRIENSLAEYETKHPLILPKCEISIMLVRNLHIKHHHAGTSLLMSIIRQNYFLLNSRRIIRDAVNRCNICRRFSAKPNFQIMGNLPIDRVQLQSPFLKTGVDFAGPLQIKQTYGRSTKLWKAYLAVFVCMSTKAVHIEVVSNLTTSNFLASLQRFIARRGLCTDMYSDNGSNFVGANNKLSDINIFLKANSNDIFSFLASEKIKWHFIPSAAPSFGGLWEAAIKSFKYHLKRVMGKQVFTYEELTTVVTQIEAVLNSRPMCVLSHEQIDALTPGHFLIGRPIVQIPQPNFWDVKLSKLSRWQHLQQTIQHFSKRWKSEYLTSLNRRTKWQTKGQPIADNDIVLIREDNLPPTKWLLGRVETIHPGADGVVRVVTLKTQAGHLKRPVYKLCKLPIDELNQQIQGGRDVEAQH